MSNPTFDGAARGRAGTTAAHMAPTGSGAGAPGAATSGIGAATDTATLGADVNGARASTPTAGTDVTGTPTPGTDVAVVGAGVVGCAVAWALTKAGRRVLLIDRADPATAGASFGNVGHIATEQLEPLPSPQVLLTFWRELVAFGGVLDIPLRRVAEMAPWMVRFAAAAFRQQTNTGHLAPLVRNAADVLESRLCEVGRGDLLRRNGHYALWLGPKAAARASAERTRASNLGIATSDAPVELVHAAMSAAHAGTSAAQVVTATARAAKPPAAGNASAVPRAPGAPVLASAAATVNSLSGAGVWFPDTAHVLDPALVARAFATASVQSGASLLRAEVLQVCPRGDRIEIVTDSRAITARTVVICAGAWSAPLLAPFGIHAPLEAERGYHVEISNHTPLVDAPILYAEHSVVITPMASRLRASSYLEFTGLSTPADPRKPTQLRTQLRQLGYRCDAEGPSWMGPRPTLPDYLPGIGRARGPHELFYAVGHQHLGLTLAAVTADLIADLVTDRIPAFDLRAFDLRRFGSL